MPIVNGHPAETGCYVDGHWGQYGIDHLADQAEGFGWKPQGLSGDPRLQRKVAERAEDRFWQWWCDRGRAFAVAAETRPWMHVPRFPNHNRGEIRCDIADEIEQWLNDRTPMVCLNCGETMCWEEGLYRAIHDHNRRMCCADGVMGKPQSYVWHWHDGEFFLSPTCEDPDDCEDLDCAHWD